MSPDGLRGLRSTPRDIRVIWFVQRKDYSKAAGDDMGCNPTYRLSCSSCPLHFVNEPAARLRRE